jgi:glycosyltransferase involved in cell wall biosynthesis
MEPNVCRQELKQLGGVVILPTYNNARTLIAVLNDVRCYAEDIMVVNDGSTDETHTLLSSVDDVIVVEYADGLNRGKGYALKTGLRKATEMGFRYAITLDSDGQHYADDIPVFVCAVKKRPDSLIIGARNLQADGMPGKNTFANKFSNFWFKVETWQTLSDTQSGYRLYPLNKLAGMRFFTPRYEFEVEIIVRATWRDIEVFNIPIKVLYPEDRISHFRPLHDFTRISILNTVLVLVALLYYYPKCFIKWLSPRNVIRFFDKHLIHSGESAARLSASVGFGVFMGIVPIWGFQMAVAVVLAHLLRLNKIIVLASSNISIPPCIPFIIYGSLWCGGAILGVPTLIDITTLTIETAWQSFVQYVVGSLAFATGMGLLTWGISFIFIRLFRK